MIEEIIYLLQVMDAVNASPGKHLKVHAEQAQVKRKRQSEKQELPSSKRQRLLDKAERAMSDEALEVSEGASYESGTNYWYIKSFLNYKIK